MTFSECQQLQRYMNGLFIGAMRLLIADVRQRNGYLSDELMDQYDQLFLQKCSLFWGVLHLAEAIADERKVTDGVRLLNPMALC